MSAGSSEEERTPRRRVDFTVERFDDGFVLYDARAERVIEMNATAAVVWELCDGTRDVATIKELLRGAYPDPGDGLDDDVDRALASFRAHQCLEG